MPDQQNQPQLMNQPQQPQQWGPRGPMQMGEGELLLKVSLSFNFFCGVSEIILFYKFNWGKCSVFNFSLFLLFLLLLLLYFGYD